VRIIDGQHILAYHRRSYDKGAQIEDAAHIQALVEQKHAARQHRGADGLSHAMKTRGPEGRPPTTEKDSNLVLANSRNSFTSDLRSAARKPTSRSEPVNGANLDGNPLKMR
jgi:hypothetical protein